MGYHENNEFRIRILDTETITFSSLEYNHRPPTTYQSSILSILIILNLSVNIVKSVITNYSNIPADSPTTKRVENNIQHGKRPLRLPNDQLCPPLPTKTGTDP